MKVKCPCSTRNQQLPTADARYTGSLAASSGMSPLAFLSCLAFFASSFCNFAGAGPHSRQLFCLFGGLLFVWYNIWIMEIFLWAVVARSERSLAACSTTHLCCAQREIRKTQVLMSGDPLLFSDRWDSQLMLRPRLPFLFPTHTRPFSGSPS